MDNSYLKYGDLIFMNVESVDGYLQSQGFSNPNCYVQQDNFGSQIFARNSRDFAFQMFPKLNYDARKDYESALKFFKRNIQQATVAKAIRKESQKDERPEGAGAKRQATIAPTSKGHQNSQSKQAQEQANFQKKLTQLKKKLMDEEDMNKRIIERRRGEHVQYGSEIQLLHVDSENFLCARKTCADIDKTCNKVDLTDHPSSSIYFKILPRYKYRQEGEKILYGDQIVLLNVKINLYLHITEKHIPVERLLPLPKLHDDPSKEITPGIFDSRAPPNNYVPMYEVNVSTTLSRFKAVPYCQYDEDDKKFLRGNTVVMLQHSEIGGYLASDDKDFTNDGLAEVFLWSFKGKTSDVENFNTSSLFEIELVVDNNRGRICRESNDREFEHLYRLRHVNTGRVVIVQEIEYGGQQICTLGLADHLDFKQPNSGKYELDATQLEELESNSLFSLIATNIDDDTRIKNSNCVQIQHFRTKQFLCVKKKAVFSVRKQRGRHSQNEDRPNMGEEGLENTLFQPIEDSEINNAYRNVLEMKAQAGYEDAFFVQILDKESLKDILFVHTSVGILKKHIPYLCSATHEISKDRLNQIEFILKMMNKFAKCEEDGNADVIADGPALAEGFGGGSENEGSDMNYIREKIIKRQKIMRELYLIEHLVQILYFPFATGKYVLADITQQDPITRICQLTYVLLKNAVGGYTVNEMYASQWVSLFFMQAMRTNNENDIFAQSTVNELLSDNKKLLEVQITPQIIKQFITLCKTQEKHKRLIKLLTALCTCFGLPIQHNQNDIIHFLLEDRETREKLMMPLKQRERNVEVRVKKNQYIPIQQLEEHSQQKDGGRIYKYFLSLVELAADLNIGRNHNAFSQLLSVFNFESVYQIIYDSTLKYDMRSYFVKLMNQMFLDREPLEPLQIPTLTVVLNDIPNLKELIQSNDLGYEIQSSKAAIPLQLYQLKNYVLQFLQSTGGTQNVADKQKNKFTFWILKSLYFMLTHGFYKNQNEVNQLALPLLLLLDGTKDIYEDQLTGSSQIGLGWNSTDRYKYSKQNEMILMSKKIQCDCLIYISQLELDGRAQLFLSKLKHDFENFHNEKTGGVQIGKMLLGHLINSPSKVDISESVMKKSTSKQMSKTDSKNLDGQSVSLLHGPLSASMQLMSRIRSQVNGNDKIPFHQSNIEFLETVAHMKGFEQEIGDIYLCILFDLMLYKYPELNETAFELLVRYFNRKASLLEQITNTQVLESKQSIEILNKVKIYHNELKIYQGEADQWMSKSDKTSVDQKLRTTEVFSFLTQFCNVNQSDQRRMMTSTNESRQGQRKGSAMTFSETKEEPKKVKDILSKLKDDDFVKQSLEQPDNMDQALSPEKEEYILFVETLKNENKENQRIMRSFEIHELAIYFIKFRMDQSEAQNQTHQNLIKQCYRFLIRFCRGNSQNQQVLREHLDIFMKYIDKYSLASQLVYEIFKDNKKFLNLNASKILKQIVNEAEEADLDSSKKGTLLKLLTVFCKCKNKLVRGNQQDIIIYLTENGVKSSILYLFSNEGFNELNYYINQCKEIEIYENFDDEKQITQTAPTIHVTTEVFNMMTCIDLLCTCCEGKSDLAEQRCQQEILPLSNVYRILEACEYFWPLKKTLIKFVTNCYLDSNSKQVLSDADEVGVKNLWLIVEVIVNDMLNITEHITNEEEVIVRYPSTKLNTLKNEALDFLIWGVIPFFKLLLKRKRVAIQASNEKAIAAFARACAKLYYITTDSKGKASAFQIMRYMYNHPQYSNFLEGIKHPLIGSANGNQETNPHLTKSDTQQIHDTLQENSRSSKLAAKISQIETNPQIKDQLEQEFSGLVKWITNIDQKVSEIVATSKDYTQDSFQQLTFNNIVSAILQMLDKKNLRKDLHLIGLKLISKIVEVENEDLLTPAADWDTDEWIEFKMMIKAKQDALVDIGCVHFICKHISEVDDEEILEQSLLNAIALLLGGNQKTQEAFLDYFQNHDEYNKVLTKVKHILIRQFDHAKTYLSEKNAKLLMIAKTQERLMKTQKTMKFQVQKAVAQKMHDIHNHDDDDDSIEQLMTLDESNETYNPENDPESSKKVESEMELDETKAHSVTKCMRILRFLQLLTENHYTPLQNFLRDQVVADGTINQKSFDFVSYISTMLGVYEKQYVNCYSCVLGYQMIETLTEFIQGPCKENQRRLVASKVIDNCRDLISQGTSGERELRLKGFLGQKGQLLDGLKQKAVRLLLSILEGPIDTEIIRSITISLDDFVVIMDRMSYVYNQFIEKELELNPKTANIVQVNEALLKDSFDGDEIVEGFDIFILVKTLSDCNPSAKQMIQPFILQEYFEFFNEHTGYIEIIGDGQEMQRVYFPVKPVCRYLSKESRQALMLNVDRTSPQQKIIGLLKAVPELVDEMEHLIQKAQVMSRKGGKGVCSIFQRMVASITPKRLNFMRDISTLLAFSISMIMLAFYGYDQIIYEDGAIDIGPTVSADIQLVIDVLGYIQLVTSFTLLIGWLFNKASLIIKAGWRTYVDANRIKYANFIKIAKEKQEQQAFSGVLKAREMSLIEARMKLLTQGPESPEFEGENGQKDFGHCMVKLEYVWNSFSFVIGNGQFIFLMVYICMSFLGQYVTPIFYSFQLLDIINRFATLRNVIQAITINKNQLLMTAMLELIIIYIYCVLGFSFLFDMYFNDDIVMEDLNEKGDSVCQNLFHCYISTINFGLRAGGGIGEFFPTISYFNYTKEEYFIRAIFDLSFFLIVIIMFFNIIFGIIIDTFASLRDDKRQIDDDMRNVCFICNIDRQTFERDSEEGFNHHIKKEHNLWMYVFLIIHMKTKDKTDYNGTESYIYEKHQQEDISWFPLMKSICLEKDKYMIKDKDDGKKRALVPSGSASGENL